MAKVSNVTRNELLGMGLTEAEVKLFIKDELVEEPKEEVVEEPIEEEVIEEEPITEPVEEIVEEPAVVEEEKEENKPAKTTKRISKTY